MRTPAMFSTLKSDLERHWDGQRGLAGNLMELGLTQGVWATVVFRLGQWVYADARPAQIRTAFKLAYKVAAKCVEVTTGISVPASARIDQGFYIGHFGAIIVHPRTVMGRGCSVGQGVTIGTRGQGSVGVPVLGDNVYVGAGAKVLGGIRIGDNVAIGANAVVVQDVPANSVAVGVPARIKPRRG